MKIAAIIGGALGALGAVIGGAWMMQDHLVYFPGPDPGHAPEPWEEINVSTDDGLVLTNWLRIDNGATGRPLIVVFPGNAGNRADRRPLGNALAEAGYGVILSEYRGYGGNPGSPSEAAIITDARALLRTTREHCDTTGGIVYFGESLGAAVAIAVAAEDPPDALILGSPFTSLADVGRVHYPRLLVDLLLRDRYASLERIERGELDGITTLVISGTADRVVPVGQSRAIGTALGAGSFEIGGADHNDSSIRSAPSMVSEVVAFITQSMSA